MDSADQPHCKHTSTYKLIKSSSIEYIITIPTRKNKTNSQHIAILTFIHYRTFTIRAA